MSVAFIAGAGTGGKEVGEVLDDEGLQRHDAGADDGAVALDGGEVGEPCDGVGPVDLWVVGVINFEELEKADDGDEADPVVGRVR